MRKGGPRAFWKRRRDDDPRDDEDDVTERSPKRMKAGGEHLRDDADKRTTIGGCLARTEALGHLKPCSESGLSMTETKPKAQHSLSQFQEVVGTLCTIVARCDIVDQSTQRGVMNNPDNPIVSLVELHELEMLVSNIQ